jgi:tripeptide aminopeptidase
MLASAILTLLASAAFSPAPAPAVDSQLASASVLVESDRFRIAKTSIAKDYDRIIENIVSLTEVPAPPFGEKARGVLYRQMLVQAGLSDVQTDAEGNVFGYRRGTGRGPLIVVAAHLDTVFPAGTAVKVTRDGDTLRAPGIGDDTASLSVLLAIARAMDAANFVTNADILFVGDVGEEGPGNLRGIRYLFEKSAIGDKIAAVISFEPDRAGVITNGGVGSKRYQVKRYQVTFRGPGGHSYDDFGLVSPAYAMADAMTRIGAMPLPAKPKTTISVGLIQGGTSINSIPAATTMSVDIRSEDSAALIRADAAFRAILPKAVERENAVRSTKAGLITSAAALIGDRPVGKTSRDSNIVRTAAAAATASGVPVSYDMSSTDSNLPMSRRVPAITLGAGFAVSRMHSLDEEMTLDRNRDIDGIAVGLATILLLAGPQ